MRTLHLLGDSQVLAFRDRVFSIPERGIVVCRATYMRGLLAKDFSDRQGALHPTLFAELVREGFLYPDMGVWRTVPSTSGLRRTTPTGARAQGQRSFVFFCGGLDAVAFVRTHRSRVEIDLPTSFPSLAEPSLEARSMSFERAQAEIARYLLPFERGLTTMKGLGFQRLYVHAASPNEAPPRGSERRRSMRRYDIDLRTFQQTIFVVNAGLREMARRLEIGFIDTTPSLLAPNGYRDSGFTRDALHLNARAAAITIDALHAAGAF